MTKQLRFLVINWIQIEDNLILVGATDNNSWKWDTDHGMSGSNAKTIVHVTLTENGGNISVSEQATFYCIPGDPTRNVAMNHLFELFEIAWDIKRNNLSSEVANSKYFGNKIEPRMTLYSNNKND